MIDSYNLKHNSYGGKAALGFGPDQIRTLVSKARDSSHRVIMGKTVLPHFLGCSMTMELSFHEHLKNIPKDL